MIWTTDELKFRSPGCATNAGLVLWLRHSKIPYIENGRGDIQVLARDAHRIDRAEDNITPLLNGELSFKREEPGVYLLKQKGEVVYVGMTKSLFGRMEKHVRGDFKFDEISFIRAPRSEVDLLETELIGRYLPKYNIINNPTKRSAK